MADNSLNSKVVKLIFSSFIFVYSLLSYDRITLFCLAHNESLIFALHVLALNVPYFYTTKSVKFYLFATSKCKGFEHPLSYRFKENKE